MAEHYAGDDTNVKTLAVGIVAAFANISVDHFETDAAAFLRSARHPTLDRGYLECAYAPMVELLSHLKANGFASYIASGGGRDFMRPISQEVYGIPREGVIGSAVTLAYTPDDRGGAITRQLVADYLDDGPEKPPAHLEPHGATSGAGCRQLQRRYRDARLHPTPGRAVAPAAGAPR
jgi:phosphoglycolate phosphatase-like HAD superfamily hydrolase